MNSREDKRIICRTEAQIEILKGCGEVFRYTALTRNLSRRGAFVYTHRPFPPGTPVRLTIFLPGCTSKAEGLVRWYQRTPKSGIGVEIHDPDYCFEALLKERQI